MIDNEDEYYESPEAKRKRRQSNYRGKHNIINTYLLASVQDSDESDYRDSLEINEW